ncbi:TetR/AcrR family transcriptional regulator [Aliiroseovarius subalbicans]|uniref:TetR/AcrR family transcriptional regulator n=1 Tax=Aliiroseovarius subalbicans TaxID=2925840 RepID=UPI001F55B98C|nr:TetR/AcrR family transcriptional regulator [Aliiroseovarius subalbicans]MCI2400561.1 TetR/AcrR family transcriptional regulator [Aliiroseovarius subalbicans]
MKDDPAPKFRRRAEDRPDELLDAAVALFIEQGYARTSVAQIAARAGLSKGAVYLYFPSKQAILEGLVARAITPVGAELMAQVAAEARDIRQMLTVFLTSLAQRLSDPATLAIPKIVIREAVVAPEIAQMYHDAVLAQALPIMIQLIQRGIDNGQFRDVDPEMTVRTVMGPVLVHIFLAEIFGIQPAGGLALDRLIDNHLTILFDGLCTPRKVPHE